MTYSFTEKKRIRNNFGTRESILKEPDLLSIQINSFNSFIQEGVMKRKILVFILFLNLYFQSQLSMVMLKLSM